LNISTARVGKANRTFVDLKRHAKRPIGTVPVEKINVTGLASRSGREGQANSIVR
jgi:hypothetical protein